MAQPAALGPTKGKVRVQRWENWNERERERENKQNGVVGEGRRCCEMAHQIVSVFQCGTDQNVWTLLT